MCTDPISSNQAQGQADAARRLRQQQQAEQIARTPRLVFELLDEIRRVHPDIAGDLDRRFERYAALDLGFLRAVGGLTFPPSPVRMVSSQ